MPRRQRDAAGHPVEEVQVVVAADQLEELELRRDVRLHDEHRLLARADGDARALLDDALLEDAPRRDQADAQDLGAGRLLHRPHDGGHLPGAPGWGVRAPGPGPWFICDMPKAPFSTEAWGVLGVRLGERWEVPVSAAGRLSFRLEATRWGVPGEARRIRPRPAPGRPRGHLAHARDEAARLRRCARRTPTCPRHGRRRRRPCR